MLGPLPDSSYRLSQASGSARGRIEQLKSGFATWVAHAQEWWHNDEDEVCIRARELPEPLAAESSVLAELVTPDLLGGKTYNYARVFVNVMAAGNEAQGESSNQR